MFFYFFSVLVPVEYLFTGPLKSYYSIYYSVPQTEPNPTTSIMYIDLPLRPLP